MDALGTDDSLGLWASGEEFNSYRMVANAWPKGPIMFIAIEACYVCLFSRFCFETKSPCLAQAGLELTVYQASFLLWSPPHSCWD